MARSALACFELSDLVVESLVRFQIIVRAFRPFELVPQIHTSELAITHVLGLEDQVIWIMYLDLLIHVHMLVLGVDVDETGDGHRVLHALLYCGVVG